MEKRIKIGLIVGIILSLLGVILFLIGYISGGRKYMETADLNRLNGKAKWEDKKPDLILEKTKLESFQTIQADLDDTNFFIQPSNDENYYISYQIRSKKEKNPISYNIEDEILKITEEKVPQFYFFHVDMKFLMDMFQKEAVEDYQEQITIYVPKQTKFQNCQIGLQDGCAAMNGFHCEKSKIELEYGDFISENASFSESSIALKDGNIRATATEFNYTEVIMSYGDFGAKDSFIKDGQMLLEDGNMEIEKTDINHMDLKLTYGDFKAKDLIIENSNILLKDGDMNGYNTNFIKENEITNLYGNITIQMKKELLENINLELKTEYGDIKTSNSLLGNKEEKGDRQYYERVVESIEHKLEVTAKDGDIMIE